MPQTVYLITGASRGIGRGLVELYLKREDTTVIAAVRNPGGKDPQSLVHLPKGPSSKLIIVKIDSEEPDSVYQAIKFLESAHKLTAIHVVIANAAINEDASLIAALPLDVLKKHIEVNSYGPLALFQAVRPLLERAGPGTKFIGIGSALGTIGGMEMRPYPMSAYGMSKTLLNYIIRKIHFEHKDITAVVLDPGFVQTDMGNRGAKAAGLDKATDTVEDSVRGLVNEIDKATKESSSGRYITFKGEDFPW